MNLTHHFLIAMPGLEDVFFAGSVVYLCEHSERGALGLIINKPTDIKLQGLFEKVDLPLGRPDLSDAPVFLGGPVQTERGFVLHPSGQHFQATLQPDGAGSHWLKVEKALRASAGVVAGDRVDLVIAPVKEEPEPVVPADVRKALAAAPEAKAVWNSLTAVARRDWIHWITSGKKAETRVKRIATACDMLASGKRRACCFDRSGMDSRGNMGAPVAAE